MAPQNTFIFYFLKWNNCISHELKKFNVYRRSIIMEPFLKGLVLVNPHRKEKKKIIAERKPGSLMFVRVRRAMKKVQNVV